MKNKLKPNIKDPQEKREKEMAKIEEMISEIKKADTINITNIVSINHLLLNNNWKKQSQLV